MRRIAVVAFTLLVAVPSHAAMPGFRLHEDDASFTPSDIDVAITVRGHLARTTFTLTYPDSRTERYLRFSLPPNAELTEVRMTSQGRTIALPLLHEADAADSLLAPWRLGGTYVQDLSYGGVAVRIAYDQELTDAPYTLDLHYGTMPRATVTVDAEDARVRAEGIRLQHNQARIGHATLDGTIRITPRAADVALVAFSPQDQLWYASAAVPVRGNGRVVPPVSRVVLLWDVSGSAARRDDAKLQAFLDAFLARQNRDVTVDVIPFHDGIDSPVRDVTRAALPGVLASLPSAGFTNLDAALDVAATIEADARIVLVTDGFDSFGSASLETISRPVTVVSASPVVEHDRLWAIAESGGGWLLDLSKLSAGEAAKRAMQPQRIDIASGAAGAGEIEPSSVLAATNEMMTVNARSQQRITGLTLNGDVRRALRVRDVGPELADMVRHAWGRVHLRTLLARGAAADELLADRENFTQNMPCPSREFLRESSDLDITDELPPDPDAEARAGLYARRIRMATPEAWLVHVVGFDPAASLRDGEWTISGTLSEADDAEASPSSANGKRKPAGNVHIKLLTGAMVADTWAERSGFRITLPAAPGSFTLRSEPRLYPFERAFPHGLPSGARLEIVSSFDRTGGWIRVKGYPAWGDGAHVVHTVPPAHAEIASPERNASIAQSITNLAARSSAAERFRSYLDARAMFGDTKRFHALAAVALHDASPELGIRAIGDLVERFPDNAAVLRLAARLVEGWGRTDLAAPLFRRAAALRAGREPIDDLARFSGEAKPDPAARVQVDLMSDAEDGFVDLHVTGPSGEEVTWNAPESFADGATLRGSKTLPFPRQTYTATAPGRYRISTRKTSDDPQFVQLTNLVHIAVFAEGQRRDFFIPLSAGDGAVTIANIDVP